MKPDLKLIRPSVEAELRALLERKTELKRASVAVDQEIGRALRLLAKERGVVFLREEHIRQEFGV